jgi:hypothetical protein
VSEAVKDSVLADTDAVVVTPGVSEIDADTDGLPAEDRVGLSDIPDAVMLLVAAVENKRVAVTLLVVNGLAVACDADAVIVLDASRVLVEVIAELGDGVCVTAVGDKDCDGEPDTVNVAVRVCVPVPVDAAVALMLGEPDEVGVGLTLAEPEPENEMDCVPTNTDADRDGVAAEEPVIENEMDCVPTNREADMESVRVPESVEV